MFRVTLDEYTVTVSGEYPSTYNEYHKRAELAEVFDSSETESSVFFLAVARRSDWPFLTVGQKYYPGPESGFHPGILLVPETRILFIGAGKRVLVYQWDPTEKLQEEMLIAGFWGWARHEQVVLMSAELELVAWDIFGKKLWSTFVEPPWDYTIDGETVYLDVMGKRSSFSLYNGPATFNE